MSSGKWTESIVDQAASCLSVAAFLRRTGAMRSACSTWAASIPTTMSAPARAALLRRVEEKTSALMPSEAKKRDARGSMGVPRCACVPALANSSSGEDESAGCWPCVFAWVVSSLANERATYSATGDRHWLPVQTKTIFIGLYPSQSSFPSSSLAASVSSSDLLRSASF